MNMERKKEAAEKQIRLGSEQYKDYVGRILRHGTGSDFLRQRYRKTGDLQKVVQSLLNEF